MSRKYSKLSMTVYSMAAAALLVAGGCAKKADPTAQNSCASPAASDSAGKTGAGYVFDPDPIIKSGNSSLSPTSMQLDSFRSQMILEHLGGHGVLQGDFVDIRNGISCNGGFGAFDAGNQFLYSHGDSRFQESMAYYFGDEYRAYLNSTGYMQPAGAVKIVAHCMQDDNAFFERHKDPTTGEVTEFVCLGDSVETPGAFYGDDAVVTVHELQHATTIDTYSTQVGLNQLWYDEAGALNEAISDFMGLIYLAPTIPNTFDPRLFSRWALGTFIPNHSGVRGAHKCPTYDSTYPNCTSFPGFSGANNNVSYVYPDGVGWPYANNFDGPGYVRSAYVNYRSQEEIHNAGVLLEGALWDVYDAIRGNHGGNQAEAQAISTKLVLEAVRRLPLPSLASVSPVNFRALAAKMVEAASADTIKLSAADTTSMTNALTARGLIGGPTLDSTWAGVGAGKAASPGMRILDNPTQLKEWMDAMGSDSTLVKQTISTGLNNQLDPGEVVAVWFDIKNTSDTTAGAVQVNVTLLDPEVTFLDAMTNAKPLSPTQAQIMYGKINGNAIVSALNTGGASYAVPTGNSYFLTNPAFDHSYTTAFWIKVSPTAAHGKTVRFQVDALPSNGASSTTTFTATIN